MTDRKPICYHCDFYVLYDKTCTKLGIERKMCDKACREFEPYIEKKPK